MSILQPLFVHEWSRFLRSLWIEVPWCCTRWPEFSDKDFRHDCSKSSFFWWAELKHCGHCYGEGGRTVSGEHQGPSTLIWEVKWGPRQKKMGRLMPKEMRISQRPLEPWSSVQVLWIGAEIVPSINYGDHLVNLEAEDHVTRNGHLQNSRNAKNFSTKTKAWPEAIERWCSDMQHGV